MALSRTWERAIGFYLNSVAHTWGANGNLLQDGSTVYAYDFANRLISTTLSGVTTQFGYNGDGIRLRLIEAGTLTTYTQDYAAPLPVVLQAKTGTASMQYVYSLGTRPLAEYEAAEWEYLLADPLGSVRQIADSSGNVTLLKSYEPYGSVLNSQGSATSVFAYAGEQIDSTGLIYLRARYMQPRLGMFLSRDPWEGDVLWPGSMNGWNYVEGNPVNATDPSGKITANAALSQLGLANPQHGTTQFDIIANAVPLELLNHLAGSICQEPSADQPRDSWIYAEGGAGVLTAGFGRYGGWVGAEIVYNLSTMQRVTFHVQGIVISRLSILGLGEADYFALATGPGLPDYGLGRESESDLATDYRGPFENHCLAKSPIATDIVTFASLGPCFFSSVDRRIRGESFGTFTGVNVDFPLPLPTYSLPVAFSYAYLNYWPKAGTIGYETIPDMANDIRAGADSPIYPKFGTLTITPFVVTARETAIALLLWIQFTR